METFQAGPDTDEERPLWEHIAELRKRVILVLGFVFVTALISFPFAGRGISMIVEKVVTEGVGVAVYTPIEYVVVQIYFMLAIGLGLGIPLIIYEAYAFMAPGLYPDEKKFYLLTIPVSVVLLSIGVLLAWAVVIPQIAPVLVSTGDEVVRPAISIQRIFFFVVGTMMLMGVVFQVPIVMALATWSEVVTPRGLMEGRLYAYFGFFFLTSLLTIDPTMASQLILTGLFIVLYEVSVRIALRFA